LEEAWLGVDWPEGEAEAYHYYLAHLHREPTAARLLRLSRFRWNIEQYFQRAKDDLGLDHYEDAVGEAFITIWSWRCWPTCSSPWFLSTQKKLLP